MVRCGVCGSELSEEKTFECPQCGKAFCESHLETPEHRCEFDSLADFVKSFKPTKFSESLSKAYRQSDYKVFKDAAIFHFEISKFFPLGLLYQTPRETPIKLDGEYQHIWKWGIMSRNHIGIGAELLLKSIFLKRGKLINRLKRKYRSTNNNPDRRNVSKYWRFSGPLYTNSRVANKYIDVSNTHSFGFLIKKLHELRLQSKLKKFRFILNSGQKRSIKVEEVKAGLEILHSWRNLDVHSANSGFRQSGMDMWVAKLSIEALLFASYDMKFEWRAKDEAALEFLKHSVEKYEGNGTTKRA